MTHLRFALGMFVIAAGIGFGLALHQKVEPEQAVGNGTQPAAYAQFDSKILRLERAIEQLRQEQETQRGSAVADQTSRTESISELAIRSGSENRETLTPDVDRPEDAGEAEKELIENTFDSLEEALSAEPFDGTWAIGQESLIADQFEEREDSTTRLVNVQCQYSLCRVELEHETEEDLYRFPMMGLADPSFAGREILSRQVESASGQMRTELFVSRRDHSLGARPRRPAQRR